MTVRTDLTIDQGANFSVSIELLDANGDPIDVSAAEAEAQMRKHYTSTNSVSFTTELVNSELILSLTSTETQALVPGRYMYDVKIIFDDDVTDRIVEGVITVSPSVTR